jgi:hypothetical protein
VTTANPNPYRRSLLRRIGGATMDALQRWAGDRARLNLSDNLQLRIELVLDGLRTRSTSMLER